jgi:hypothetical protein
LELTPLEVRVFASQIQSMEAAGGALSIRAAENLKNEKTNSPCGIQPSLTLYEISVTGASFFLAL